MNTSAQSLLAAGQCYRSYGQPSTAMLIKLGLLQSIALTLNAAVDTSAKTLLSEANCDLSYSNANAAQLIEIGLLRLIANNIGGSSSSSQPSGITYAGPPLFTPTQTNGEPYIVVDSNGRQWQYFGGAWH